MPLSAFAEEARRSPALEQAVKIEAAIELCKLFNAIPRSSPKFNEIAARGTTIYGKAALELNVPVPEAIKLSENRAAVLIEELRKTDQVDRFCQAMKKEDRVTVRRTVSASDM